MFHVRQQTERDRKQPLPCRLLGTLSDGVRWASDPDVKWAFYPRRRSTEMGKLARINAARKAAGLPVDNNNYQRKPASTRVTPIVRQGIVAAMLKAMVKGGGK